MATRRSRVPPPRPGQPVPKEYVREQLDILGIKNVSEQEIESYAAGKATAVFPSITYLLSNYFVLW